MEWKARRDRSRDKEENKDKDDGIDDADTTQEPAVGIPVQFGTYLPGSGSG